jgi:hypothetical protein
MHYVYLETFAHIEVFESTFMSVYVWQCDNINVFVKNTTIILANGLVINL